MPKLHAAQIVSAALATLSMSATIGCAIPPSTVETGLKGDAFLGGHWWNGAEYLDRPMYVVDGYLSTTAPERIDHVVDLSGQYVLPPLAEGHNHWLEPRYSADYNECHIADGVFYVRDLGNIPFLLDQFVDRLNQSDTVDFVSAGLGFTGPGGHPLEIIEELSAVGALPLQWAGDDTLYDKNAIYIVETEADIDARFSQLIAKRPAMVKAYLLFSEHYDALLSEPATRGANRGMNPALVPHLVARSHAEGLRVFVHTYTAADFRNAVSAGADEIAHLPGLGYREQLGVDAYLLTPADVRSAHDAGIRVISTIGFMVELRNEDPAQYRFLRDQIIGPNLRILRDGGVPIMLGSDLLRQTVRQEILALAELDVFGGAELINMATRDTARDIFPNRSVGCLASGCEASFLAYTHDPVADIKNLGSISLRVKQGRLLTATETMVNRETPLCTTAPY